MYDTKLTDTEAARRRIDEQDRLDAEENMVTAMISSTTISSSSLSVSSKRRSRPPTIPPPPHSALMMAPPKKWIVTSRTVKIISMAVAVVTTISLGTVIAMKNQLFMRGSGDASAFMTHTKLPSRTVRYHHQRNNHRIQRSKYKGIAIPELFERNVKSFRDPLESNEFPILWRIPMSCDETVSQAMGECLGMVLASDQTELLRNVKPHTPELEVIETEAGNVMNIDLNTRAGVGLAQTLQIVSKGLVHAITTPHLNVVQLLQDDHEPKSGRLFAMFRHPVDRLEAYYRAASNRAHRYYDPELQGKTLEQYANWPTDRTEFNFVTKSLVSSGEALVASRDLTEQDLELAKAILKEKVLVLLQQDKLGSWLKLASWMGWRTTQDQQNCVDRVLMERIERPQLDSQSKTYIRLSERSAWDSQLFYYAADLYQEQTESLV